jgi:hypothetical protein
MKSGMSFLGLMILALIAARPAMAAGVLCENLDQTEQIEVRYSSDFLVAEIMIFRDLLHLPENQHIATFMAEDQLLVTEDTVIHARVDLTNPKSSRKGERIGGTRLGALSRIVFESNFSSTSLPEPGHLFSAEVIYQKRNGHILKQDFDCVIFAAPTAQGIIVQPY